MSTDIEQIRLEAAGCPIQGDAITLIHQRMVVEGGASIAERDIEQERERARRRTLEQAQPVAASKPTYDPPIQIDLTDHEPPKLWVARCVWWDEKPIRATTVFGVFTSGDAAHEACCWGYVCDAIDAVESEEGEDALSFYEALDEATSDTDYVYDVEEATGIDPDADTAWLIEGVRNAAGVFRAEHDEAPEARRLRLIDRVTDAIDTYADAQAES